MVPLEEQDVDATDNDTELVIPESEIQSILDQIQEPPPQLDIEGTSAMQLFQLCVFFRRFSSTS